MKVKKTLRESDKTKIRKKRKSDPLRSFVFLTVWALLAVTIAVGSRITGVGERTQVFAASDTSQVLSRVSKKASQAYSSLPTGIAGVVSGVTETTQTGATVKRMGTSCEEVMVGQRVTKVNNRATEFNVSSSMASKMEDFDSAAMSLSKTAKLMSDSDYDTLLRIVEAEAGEEDVKGRVLVANVIMNRVKHEGFPDSVTDVVWQYVNGVPQFSPIYDRRFYEVTVTDETREAVRQALEGVDYSQGALFFIQKSAAEKQNIAWFEKDLKKLFKYGVHEFYTYPDEIQDDSSADDVMFVASEAILYNNEENEDNVVQMAKADILE